MVFYLLWQPHTHVTQKIFLLRFFWVRSKQRVYSRMSLVSTAELQISSDPKKWVPFPSLIEPKKFNSVVDTEGILKKVWGKKSVGQIFVFFDMWHHFHWDHITKNIYSSTICFTVQKNKQPTPKPPLPKTSRSGFEKTTFRQPPSYITAESRFYDTECPSMLQQSFKKFPSPKCRCNFESICAWTFKPQQTQCMNIQTPTDTMHQLLQRQQWQRLWWR